MSFLKGLGDIYINVKTQILLMDPLPSINRVFSLVQQQERQLAGGELAESKSAIINNVDSQELKFQGQGYREGQFNTWKQHGGWKSQGRARSKNYGKQCSYCHKMNHSVDECYSKHSFPPWMKQRYKSNINQIETQQEASRNMEEHNSQQADQFLRSEQVQQLLKMLHNYEQSNRRVNTISEEKSTQNVKGNTFWVLDMGATDHLTCLRNIFISFRKIKPLKINLPNGTFVQSNYAGTVRLTENLTIYDVYYVPAFTLNIVSIQTLITHSDIQCVFSHDVCHIQDTHTLKMIGHARLVEGLYRVADEDMCNVNNMTSFRTCNIDIWHFRLGHPSNKILDNICKNYTGIKYDLNNICEYCHYGKQHRLRFQTSETVTSDIFDLIHVDIWGPCNISSMHGHRYFLILFDDHSKHTWVFLMKNKSETRSLLNNFVIYA